MQKAATAQGITLKMLPTLFERRKANQTTITQKNKIMWTLEWVFEEAEAKWIEKGECSGSAQHQCTPSLTLYAAYWAVACIDASQKSIPFLWSPLENMHTAVHFTSLRA